MHPTAIPLPHPRPKPHQQPRRMGVGYRGRLTGCVLRNGNELRRVFERIESGNVVGNWMGNAARIMCAGTEVMAHVIGASVRCPLAKRRADAKEYP